jgi:hypothetical protein
MLTLACYVKWEPIWIMAIVKVRSHTSEPQLIALQSYSVKI